MAFGDALRPTDGATVKLHVDTSETAKLKQAEAQWRESVGSMSREALKLDLAQDRLSKSLSKYGAESNQAKRATIALKDAEEQATRAANRQAKELRDVHTATLQASSGYASMRNRVVGLAAAYVGVHGLVSVIRSSVAAAKEEQLIRGQTKIALEAVNIAYEEHAGKIEKVIRAVSRLGFDDEELLQSFQLLIGGAKDVDTALTRVALAAGVARGRYRDLEFGTQIVNKAQLGMVGTLRRLGLDIDKNASATEALDMLTRRYGKSAEVAMDTAQAAGDRAAVSWENLKEIMGGALLPQITEYSNRVADWLSKAENQREVQERVNAAVETGEDVVRGLSAAIRGIKTVTEPVIDALGGLEKAVELALIVGFVMKIRKAAASFGLLAAASAVTRTKVIADAAAMGAALDIATRPRVVPIGVVGAGAFPGGGKGPKGGGFGWWKAGLAALATRGAAATTIAVVASAGGGTQRGDRSGQYPLVFASVRNGPSAAEQAILSEELGQYSLANAPDENLRRAERRLRALLRASMPGGGPVVGGASVGSEAPTARPGGRDGGRGGRSELDIEVDLARARTTPGRGDDERLIREQRELYRRQIRALEERGARTKEQKEKLAALYGRLQGTQSELDSIENEREEKLRDAREKQRERRRKEFEKEERALRAEMEQAQNRIQKRREREVRRDKGIRGAMEKAEDRVRDRIERGERAGGGGITKADLARMQIDWLRGLHGMVGQFAGNLDEGGPVASHTIVQTALLRDQNQKLERLARGQWHPGTVASRGTLAAAGWGVGF